MSDEHILLHLGIFTHTGFILSKVRDPCTGLDSSPSVHMKTYIETQPCTESILSSVHLIGLLDPRSQTITIFPSSFRFNLRAPQLIQRTASTFVLSNMTVHLLTRLQIESNLWIRDNKLLSHGLNQTIIYRLLFNL